MARGKPDTAGKWHAYDNLRPQEKAAMRARSHPEYRERLKVMRKRKIMPERGINLGAIPLPQLAQTVNLRGWHQFIHMRNPYDPELVREFYAAMIPGIFNEFHSVVVRGITVHMPMQAICDHYNVERPQHLGMSYGVSQITGVAANDTYSPIIASSLRRNGQGYWRQNDDEVRKSELHYDLAIWMIFLKASLKPSKHKTYADPHVARVLYCIQHNLPLDIGHIIQLEMVDAAGPREGSSLPFPSLITHFCRMAGLQTGQLVTPPGDIDRRTYLAQQNAARGREAAIALEREDVQVPAEVDDADVDDVDYGDEEDDDEDAPPQQRSTMSRSDLEFLTQHFNRSFEAMRREINQGLQDERTERNQGFQDLRTEMRQGFQDLREEMHTSVGWGGYGAGPSEQRGGGAGPSYSQTYQRRVRPRPDEP